MRALIGVKRVIDFATRVRVNPARNGIVRDNVKMSMNPFDEIAVEEGIRLKERGVAKDLVALTIGPSAAQETLRTALAMGVDRAIHVETDEELEALSVAKLLRKVVDKEQPSIVLLGKQAIDDDACQTGQILAGLLGWPQATFASKLTFDPDRKTADVTREVDGGLETVRVRLPFVLTVDLRLNEPRYATLPNIMKAKRQPITKFSVADLGVDVSPRTQILSVSEPPTRKGGIKVDTVDQLLDKLRNEAKVI